MSELSPRSRRLLDAAQGEHPSAADEARIRQLLQQRLAAGPPAPRVPAWAKAGVCGLGIAAALVASQISPGRRAATPTQVSTGSALPVVAVPPAEVPAPSQGGPLPTSPQRSPPRPTRLPVPPGAAPTIGKEPALPSPPEQGVPADTLAEELALLSQARRALAAHQGQDALELLERHQARFPWGVLREERELTEVLTLCELGRTDAAQAEATALVLDGFPVERLVGSCAAQP